MMLKDFLTKIKIFRNGLTTGLILQLAIGPVFFFIINVTLQKTIIDGFARVVAVTLVDYFYITLSIVGIGKLLENKRTKTIFGIVSSIVLILFGLIIIKGAITYESTMSEVNSASLFSSFSSVFLLTISSPMTIVFFTSLFTSKAVEYNYTKNELLIFGVGTGFATFLFMGTSVLLFYLMKGAVSLFTIQMLNMLVGCLLIGYGGMRLVKNIENK